MKALTIWQPWASLIMIGAKPFEFRPRSFQRYIGAPAVGERIVIHAGARPVRPNEIVDLLQRLNDPNGSTGLTVAARSLLERILDSHKCRLLPLGHGLGTAVIGQPRNAGALFGRVADSDRQAADLEAYNWAWPLTDIQPFEPPIPARGAQGFWNWPA